MTNRSSLSGLLTSICHCSFDICHLSFDGKSSLDQQSLQEVVANLYLRSEIPAEGVAQQTIEKVNRFRIRLVKILAQAQRADEQLPFAHLAFENVSCSRQVLGLAQERRRGSNRSNQRGQVLGPVVQREGVGSFQEIEKLQIAKPLLRKATQGRMIRNQRAERAARGREECRVALTFKLAAI